MPIQKVANTSIRHSLAKREAEGLYGDCDPSVWDNHSFHKSFFEYLPHNEILKLKKDYIIFAVVRNPIARLFSCYRSKLLLPMKANRHNILSHYGMELGMEFSEFVRQVSRIPDREADRHFRSQTWFITCGNQMLPDHLLRLENLGTDWNVISQRYGLAPPPKLNQPYTGPGLEEIYDPATVELAVQRYQDDIKLLGYRPEVEEILRQISDRQAEKINA